MRERTRWRLIFAAAFLVPMAMVKATELYLSRALPQQAEAASPGGDTPQSTISSIVELLDASAGLRKPLSDEQRQLVEYVHHVRSRPTTRSPFEWHVVVTEQPNTPVVDPPIVAPVLTVNVHALMRTLDGITVLIDNTLYREDDTISDGGEDGGYWIIRSINPTARTVTFEHSSGTAEESRKVLR